MCGKESVHEVIAYLRCPPLQIVEEYEGVLDVVVAARSVALWMLSSNQEGHSKIILDTAAEIRERERGERERERERERRKVVGKERRQEKKQEKGQGEKRWIKEV